MTGQPLGLSEPNGYPCTDKEVKEAVPDSFTQQLLKPGGDAEGHPQAFDMVLHHIVVSKLE